MVLYKSYIRPFFLPFIVPLWRNRMKVRLPCKGKSFVRT